MPGTDVTVVSAPAGAILQFLETGTLRAPHEGTCSAASRRRRHGERGVLLDLQLGAAVGALMVGALAVGAQSPALQTPLMLLGLSVGMYSLAMRALRFIG